MIRRRTITRLLAALMLALTLLLRLGPAAAQDEAATPTPESAEEAPPEEPTATPAPTETPPPDLGQPALPVAAESPWLEPQNLSRSGATGDPQLVVDSSGTFHVFWRDAIDGYVYTRSGDGTTWTAPAAPELPFFTRQYFPELEFDEATPIFDARFVADSAGRVHAFWIDTTDDGETLYHSSVPAGSVADFPAWTGRAVVADSATKVAAAAGPNGQLHAAFIRPLDAPGAPAGVYYRRLEADGNWAAPVSLYASRYMRAIPPAEAVLEVAVQDALRLYIGWADNPLERVFVARSNNGGRSWNEPLEVDRRSREDQPGSASPSAIRIGASDGQVLLTWRAGHEPDATCTQYFRVSDDSGENWSVRQQLEELPTCFDTAQFVEAGTIPFLLGTTVEESAQRNAAPIRTAYLLAWDGQRWSPPQQQDPLTAFFNAETDQVVTLACHDARGVGDQIHVVGCDTASGDDIWLASRPVGDVAAWFPPPPIWQGPNLVTAGIPRPDTIQLVAGPEGTTDAFWFVPDSRDILHARWDGIQWSAARPIITSPQGSIEQISAAAGRERLFLVWRDQNAGLYYSQAAINQPAEWAAAAPLTEGQPSAGSPSALITSGGEFVVAYTLPLNEQRGVYVTRSADAGATWAAPVLVFDARDAQWDMVDSASLTQTTDGRLYLLWLRRTLPPNAQPLSLAFSRSEPGGRDWSEAETVADVPATWHTLVGVGERTLHRLWVEDSGTRAVLWHAVSEDGGLTSSQPAQVAGWESGSLPAITADPGLRPHILLLAGGRLQQWQWDGARWLIEPDQETGLAGDATLGAAARSDGQLVALYAGRLPGQGEDTEAVDLYTSYRQLELPTELPAPLPTLTPTPGPTATPAPTATPEPTPTVAFSTEANNDPLSGGIALPGGLTTTQILTAVVPALLIGIIGLIVGLRVARRRR